MGILRKVAVGSIILGALAASKKRSVIAKTVKKVAGRVAKDVVQSEVHNAKNAVRRPGTSRRKTTSSKRAR